MYYSYRYSRERQDIIVAVLGLTLAFFIVIVRSSRVFSAAVAALALGESLLITLTAFLLHEMSHRYFARSYGGIAYFRLWPLGLVLALVTSVIGIIFAAPGAVNIGGIYRRDQVGKVALAGPGANIAMSVVFLMAYLLAGHAGIVSPILQELSELNAWFALFNMIPVPPLDGQKVLSWDIRAFGATLAIALILFLILIV
ncbi:hypothetical protein GCM10007108_09400 [Thermogymnomonas acidicola]|uniref:Site-2 protease family protein n=1 Tax=Thermogymnomonas acidicola TaxID=399579 RepID=A0AA37BRG0_9ARCH|nr:site-2 protease family protein [Thermogymnomonas acidicola]GGM73530.1 hypothetical protein GCM10007108_09400 [Thermogymnomonas acidicola]